MSQFHQPILAKEALKFLAVKPGKNYIDATIGGGGHTKLILEQSGKVLGIDRDLDAINFAKTSLGKNSNLTLIQGNFDNLTILAKTNGFEEISGILFDFGVSSFQLDTASRGFSFQKTAPLDMRMDHQLAVTAADLVNALSKKELYDLLTKFAQEKRARAIAAAIVRARTKEPITTTTQLATLIANVYGGQKGKPVRRKGGLHPATKVFQALRIAVNDELNAIKTALPQALKLLKPKGRLVTISFHEGEDRIVKQFLNQNKQYLSILTKKPIQPTKAEIRSNPRARSAKLRAAQKL